ncbi:MAG: MBL fold metallo-hydrolase, partial [Faecalibacillus sp.]
VVLKIHEGDLASLSSTIKNGEFKIETFKNGDSVTAGDRQLKVYNLKGHTDGSCALLDEEDHVAFTGDALGSGTIWFGNGKDQLVDLKKDVDLFVSTVKDMDDLALYTGHRWQEAQGDAHSNGVAVQEIGQQYVFEMQELLNNIAENNYDVNSDFAPAGGNPNASAIYSEDADLNKDGYYPGIFVRGQDPVKELQSSTNIIGGNLTKALNAIQTPLTEKDGSKKEYALSSTLRSHLSQENLMAEKDENNKTLTIDQQLDGVFLSSDYVNGKSEAGISYYNMLNFYATLLQARQMLEANEGYKIVDNQGKEYDLALIDEFIGLVKQINDFDPTTDLKYDWKSAYDTEEFKNETQRGGVDVIATSKEGNISFEFHIDSHGWWGYDLGAHDSITGLVLGLDAETAKEQQHDLTLNYGQFFVIKMKENDKGTWYLLNGTDLENPIIYVSKDKKEAFMIDVDMYGGNALNDVIKSVIGEECKTLNIFLTHNHGDHINNLAVIGQDEQLRKITTIYWPENEPHVTLTDKDGTVKELVGKDLVSDIQWKEVKTLKDMEKFTAAGVEFQFIEIPNEHTPGGGQLADLTNKVIYSGDTLGAQIHLGGTTVRSNSAQAWLDGAKKASKYIEENDIQYNIGGHTPYLNNPEFASWLATGIEYAMKNATDGYNLIVVEDGKVINGTDRFGEVMGNGLTDREELNICSLGYIKSSVSTVLGDVNKAYDEIKTPLTEKDGSKKEYALSSTLRSHLSQENLMAEKDENNKTLTIDQQLDGVFLSSDYVNGKSEAGISYYNMLNFYATLLQARQMLEANEGYKIVDNQGKEYDLALIDEFIGLVKQINDFDPTTDLKYDWKSAYDTEEFKNETQRGGVDVIATSKEGNISFEFHIDSHGWWGYDLGAHDSITGLVLGLDAETAKEQQHDLTLNYGQFFVIKMKENDKGTWYLLNGTDLENPIIYVSKDKKEAFMIDVDMYGGNALNDVIKSVIGEECKTLNIFLTHNHGDHINNLAVIGQDEQLRKITTIYWPENEPHVTLTDKDGTVKELVGKDLVSDIQWKEVKTLKDMEKFTAAGVEFQFIEIPNEHTPGGGQLADLTNKVIYSGDTLGAQIHLGGTTVRSNSAQAWLDGAKKASKYIEENDIQYNIGGHTPYLNNPEFASWLATGIEYAMKNATDGYNLIVVEDGKVINGTDRFGEVMGNGLTDREELNICSLGYIKSAPEDPTPEDPTDPAPEDPQKPAISDTEETKKEQTGEQVKTGDEMNIYGYALTFVAASLLFVLLKKRKLNK